MTSAARGGLNKETDLWRCQHGCASGGPAPWTSRSRPPAGRSSTQPSCSRVRLRLQQTGSPEAGSPVHLKYRQIYRSGDGARNRIQRFDVEGGNLNEVNEHRLLVATMQTCKFAGISLPLWFKLMRFSQGSHLTPQSFLIHMRCLSHKHTYTPKTRQLRLKRLLLILNALFPVRVATSQSGLNVSHNRGLTHAFVCA